MKKLLVIFTFLAVAVSMQAQRFAYVDAQYILKQMPEYKEAQKELDALSSRWQETVEAKYAEIDKMKKAYQAEKILLTPDMRKKREAEIKEKEEEARKYQRDKFGVEGELFKKRQELIQPLQDEIFEAIKELARDRSYAVIFDKSAGNSNILFSDPRYDKSDVIIRKLGLSTSDE
ncbi:OmpH family outer membrane protein [Salibacter halophilus]|uniref:OmpH family outer membrane protein n=1 Tax=Salibacter halophilus TaxID=1803916 RepID=A0A6N6M1V4_9FLAO|nr:OmpH family outer membrane protein [Salibacter halophilus]KAB1062820.1 OmpH family outer membrane protein [Salibacter halophilus]